MSISYLFTFLKSQLITSLPYPTEPFTDKTVIVTGSNVGLGKEAARHILRLGAAKVILAVRSIEKGDDAKRDIEQSDPSVKGVVQVWQLDMASYDSVKEFAARAAKELDRVDVLLENAGLATGIFSMAEENEKTLTVNVVSTFLLAFLMMPQLRDTAQKFNTRPVLTIVSSEAHHFTTLKVQDVPTGQIFATLNDKSKADMPARYPLSKLLEIFVVRNLAEKHPASSFPVTVNTVNPGLCHSELARESGWGVHILKLLLARTTEYGSRTLVHAAAQGPESHGAYLHDCAIDAPSSFVRSEEGKHAQQRVWEELLQKLNRIEASVSDDAGIPASK